MKLLTLLSTFFLANSAHALIGGNIDANTPDSDFAGVGAVLANGGTFSGALIGSEYVLTAAHVLPGNVSSISFRVNDGSNTTIAAAEVFKLPGFTGTTPGADGIWHDDLAIIRLASPVAGSVPFYELFTGPVTSGLFATTLTMVGYGAGGNGIDGVTVGANPGVKRVGRNVVSRVYTDDDGSGQDESFEYSFDQFFALNDEAHFAGGDSGGPVFVFDDGRWKVAGVANGISAASAAQLDNFGATGFGTLVSANADWILAVTQPVPEPETWAMMLVGLGLVGALAARRRRCKAD